MTTSATSRPARRRGALPAGRAVTASVARTAATLAARTTSVTVTVAATGARAAATKLRAARAAGARRTAAASTAGTAPPVEAPAPEVIAAEPVAIVQRPTLRPEAVQPGDRTQPVAPAVAPPVAPAVAPAVVPAAPAPAAVGPAAEDVVLRGEGAAGRAERTDGSARVPLRRPALYLAAAAAVAVVGLGGGLAAAGPAAQADTPTASAPVSVAARLGITAETAAPIVDAETTDRLGELVASRAERDADQVRAARVQAKADRAAAVAERRAAAAAAEAARPDAVLPVKGARLTSGFGARWGTLHAGIDLAAPMRTPEYAVLDGIVLEAGPASGYGLAVYIQHENGDVTVYGHMDEILVSAGQVVKAGDTIALLGNTGQSTGPHLHFEVHQGGLDGTAIDPLPWLRAHGLRI